MTLTELKYIIAVARHKHFGQAADACYVAQPTLSVAIKKLEDELGVAIFERGGNEVTTTRIGEQIIAQAEKVLEQASRIKEIALQNQGPLTGPLRLGIIFTIAPYILPSLVKTLIQQVPQMPLVLQENYTHKLLEYLRQGEIDAAIMAYPLPDNHFQIRDLYTEPFVVALPKDHPWESRAAINATELKSENMLLLGSGHCFRDQVLEICPEMMRFSTQQDGIARTFEGSSLETIRYMVASGIGLTVLPRTAVPDMQSQDSMLRYKPFETKLDQIAPSRRVIIAYRKTFSRPQAIDAIQKALHDCQFAGISYH